MEPSEIAVDKRYKFRYADIEMIGVCKGLRGTPPWPITMKTDDGLYFGVYPSMLIEEVE